ncbi:SDA1-domain-containing protein [Lineolata rhizophorae]|uniref:Protein SDA1 n=1 Tax=Lineolata rhizophorae TaxID=578093 RepID=A0A6A6PD56_9PEZI|nr:SDA1-domain-containing protein [Lineolata rhizophorae]
MGKRKVGALEKVDADLTNLQHKIRRDPSSYQDDFRNQYAQYDTFKSLFLENPASNPEVGVISFRDLVDFIAHVADCYPDLTARFPQDLVDILTLHHDKLEYELRDKLVGSLVLLRNKDVINSSILLNALFPILVSTNSKSLRALLFKKILSDLRSCNAKATDHRLNRTIQTVLYNLVTSDRASPKSVWAVKLTRELWKRQIWTDAKAVDIMKEASLTDNEKVVVGGVQFFLGGDQEREDAIEESDDDEDGIDVGRLKHQAGVNKKSKKQDRQLKKAAAMVRKKEKKKGKPHPLNFSALHLLHDPQSFAESLFHKHLQQQRKNKFALEHKLLVLNLVTRLTGLHRLTIEQLYSYLLKYLAPRQPSVTSFLAALAQATHPLVPPETLAPLVHKIATEFVSEASASEVAASGLNAIREVCSRQPLALEATLLQDLVQYRKSRDKSVVMAARALLSLYRDVGPEKLARKDRGRDAALAMRDGGGVERRFGEDDMAGVDGGIEGIELLAEWREAERKRRRREKGLPSDADSDEEGEKIGLSEEEEEEGWKNWDVESTDSDSSGGWIDVASDGGENFEISDSEDEKRAKKKARTTKEFEAEAKFGVTNGSALEAHDGGNSGPSDTQQTPVALSEREATLATNPAKRLSSLATTRILTPADLAKLHELRIQQSLQSHLPSSHKRHHAAPKRNGNNVGGLANRADDPVTAESIALPAHLGTKATKEEKIAAAKADRQEKHLGKEAKKRQRKREQGKSSTNKEKERQKNMIMMLGKARKKGKRPLGDVRKALKSGGKGGRKGR